MEIWMLWYYKHFQHNTINIIFIQYLLNFYSTCHFNWTFYFYSESLKCKYKSTFFRLSNMKRFTICCMLIQRDVIIYVYWEASLAAACPAIRRHYEGDARATKICIITRICCIATSKVKCNQGRQVRNWILETNRNVRISWRRELLVGAFGEQRYALRVYIGLWARYIAVGNGPKYPIKFDDMVKINFEKRQLPY